MQNTKKSMLASGLAVLVCVAMLIGTTFAWFTDSVTNSGNTIKAGSLAIDANAYDIGEGGLTVTGLTDIAPATVTFEENGQNLKQDATPILTEENWEPGQSSAKLLKLKNSGTLNAKVQLNFDISGDLTDALWYDFVQVNPESGAAIGQCTKRAMSTLPELAAARELTLAPGAEVAFVFAYGMNTDAGNDYQNGTFQANVSIAAKQAPVEKDGFGSDQYDKDAVYLTSDQLADAVENAQPGATLQLADGQYTADITVKKSITLQGNGNTVFTGTITTSGDVDFAVKGIHFGEGSSINGSGASDLTIQNCVVDFGTSQFLVDTKEGSRSVRYTITGNTFNGTSYPMMTWPSAADGSEFRNNTFGSPDQYIGGFAFRTMNVDDGATITVSGNTVYCRGYQAFSFYNNANRAANYTVVFEDNTTYVNQASDGVNGFLWIESRVAREDIIANVVLKGNNTYNGAPVTQSNIKHANLTLNVTEE